MTFVTVEDSFEISKYGENNYDNIVVILTSSKRYDSLKKKEFRTFLEMHGNIFLAFDNSPSDFVRNLAGFSGVEIDADQSKVVDYFNAVDGDPSLFQTTDYPKVGIASLPFPRTPTSSVTCPHTATRSSTAAWACAWTRTTCLRSARWAAT